MPKGAFLGLSKIAEIQGDIGWRAIVAMLI